MSYGRRARILVVDNSHDYSRSLRSLLELEEYHVEEAGSVEETGEWLDASDFDLALIDLRLTDDSDEYDFSGLEAAKLAGEAGVPCLVVTAFPTVEATRRALRSRGIEPLAVDLVPKESGPEAVLDAIEAVLRRCGQRSAKTTGGLEFDPGRRLFLLGGEPLRLSRYQYAFLVTLHEARGAVCSHEVLLRAIYDEDVPPGLASSDRRLEHLADRLRQKLEDDPSEPRYLITVHGRGYRLALEP